MFKTLVVLSSQISQNLIHSHEFSFKMQGTVFFFSSRGCEIESVGSARDTMTSGYFVCSKFNLTKLTEMSNSLPVE